MRVKNVEACRPRQWMPGLKASMKGGSDQAGRIDHAFVSRGTVVVDARYVDSPASDHPAVNVSMRR